MGCHFHAFYELGISKALKKKKKLCVTRACGARASAVTHLASATPNMQPPTVDQKPIQPAPTCALGGNGGEGEKEEKGRTEEGREERRLLAFKMQSVTVRTESDKEQPLSV